MENAHQLADRFREVLLTGKWVAQTNFKELLSDLTWQEATQKIGSLNTLAVLVYHINYYIAGILPVFAGGTLDIRDKYSFDLPPIQSQEDWEKLLNKIWSDAEQFAKAVEQMPEEQLAAVFVKAEYGNFRRNIEGVIEHSYYHLGQIALLKKMIRDGT